MVEVIIAAAELDDLALLLERRRPDIDVITVPADADAHAVLTDVLAQRPAAIHLLAHGTPGAVLLGARPLDAASLLDRAWPDAAGTEILIHACRVAEGEAGRLFLDRLAAATGARVAASTQPMGAAELGGTWAFDAATAPVATPSAFAGAAFSGPGAWPHLLGPNDRYVVTGQDVDLTGTDLSNYGGVQSTFDGSSTIRITLDQARALNFVGSTPQPNDADRVEIQPLSAETTVNVDLSGLSVEHVDVVHLVASKNADYIVGSRGHDFIEAGEGDDTVRGGDGSDVIVGYLGNDVFLYSGHETGLDFLANFGRRGTDTIRIDGAELQGPVTLGDGTTVGRGQIQAEYRAGGEDTRLYIGLDDVAGADMVIDLNEWIDTSLFQVHGSDIDLSGSVGHTARAHLAIAPANAAQAEGSNGTTAYTFTVTRSGLTLNAASASWSVSGSGANAADAADFGGALPGGTVSFAAGETSATITVMVSGDATREPDEGFTVTLDSPADGTVIDVASAQAVIRDDDAPPASGGDTGTGGSTGGGSTGGGSTGGGDTGGGTGGGTTTPPPGNAAVSGGAGDDVLTGGDANDVLYGDAGNDSVTAGLGDDILYGNQGTDVLYGNLGMDTLFGGQDADTVFGGQDADVIYGNMANDALYGNMANDTLFGGQGDDSIFGGQGDDVVAGNLGDDVLNGNLGNDTLMGGAGADRFVFASGGGADTVSDFDFAQGDRIQVAAGMTWTIADGPNGAVISFGTGDQITLTGISATNVTSGWIVTG